MRELPMQVLRTEAIERFLKAKTHPDLSAMYNKNMEVQVSVGRCDGRRHDTEYKGRRLMAWTDGIQVWKSFRIPYNAATNPEYEDVPMSFDLEKYVEGIGMTGWDWVNKVSKWVGFDFDAISGHSENHSSKLNVDELEKVKQEASNIEWVTVRKSTSGKGLHLYVFLPDVPTKNHTEHAALARAILGQMSAITGFPFTAKVDACGHILWQWHVKMIGTDGLTLIKQGRCMYEDEIPKNWEDHINVITGKKRRVQILSEEKEQDLDDLIGQKVHVNFDEGHKKLIEYLQNNFPNGWWYDQDRHMLVTHTYHLKKAHDDLQLRGIFETIATGSQAGNDWNCFAFPLRKGAWSVRRYTKGVKEAPTWEQDSQGWTRCYLNKDPTLALAARSKNGIENEKGEFVFATAEDAQKVAMMLGIDIGIPHGALNKKCILKEHKDGRLVVKVFTDPVIDQGINFTGWLPSKKLDEWTRIFNANLALSEQEVETSTYDDMIRHLVDESGKDSGWVIKTNEEWHEEPLSNITLALKSLGLNLKEAQQLQGTSVLQCWKLVNKPFQPEYPGMRQWNRNAAQFAFVPNTTLDNLKFPTWMKVMEHCGKSLNEAIAEHPWCKDFGILTGADYLKIWLASVFQHPLKPLPYLFFYGPQNTGKSTFHQAIRLLLKNGKGYIRADKALSTDFNAEIEGAIICVTEEVNMRKDKKVYEKIRDLVTSPQILIHPKGMTPYLVTNSTHWIQCANEFDACPIFKGDTRVTMIYVGEFAERMDTHQMFINLEKEAPDFLAELLKIEIPPSYDRLNVPVIVTDDKKVAEDNSRSMLQIFLEENCHYFPGRMITVKEFFNKFTEWLPMDEVPYWTKQRVSRELPPPFIRGRSPKNAQLHYGNISFEKPTEKDLVGPKLVLDHKNGILRLSTTVRPV